MTRAFCWIALVMLFGTGSTRIVSAQARVGVGSFEGPSGSRARASVVQAIEKDGATVVGENDVQAAADASHADIATGTGRMAVARELKLSALVAGVVQHARGGQLNARITVYDGATGSQLGEATIGARAPALVRRVRAEFSSELGAAIAQGRAPETEADTEPAPAVEAESDAVTEAEPKPDVADRPEPEPEAAHQPRPRALEVSLGVRVQTRGFHYNDALTSLGEHSLDPTPAARLELRWYPAAHFTDGFIANLGLDVHAQMMWPVDATRGSLSFNTTSKAFGAGLRLRVPLGAPDKNELGVLVGYGVQDFVIDDASGGQKPGVPAVSYGFVRIGADGRWVLSSSLSLDLRAAYLVLTGYGQLAAPAWYPHTSGGGVEADLTLGIALSEMLAIRVGAGMVRYFMSLNPKPTDAGVLVNGRIAGGATDQMLYGTAGLALNF